MKSLPVLALVLSLGSPLRAGDAPAKAVAPAPGTAASPLPVPAQATLAEARQVTDQIPLAAMMRKVLEQQRTMVDKTIHRMMPQLHPGATPADLQKAIVRQKKMMDLIWASIDVQDVQNQMAEVYRDVFTPDELHGIAAFYGTPAGRAAIEKQPQIQERMMQAIMPRIMMALRQAQLRAAVQDRPTGSLKPAS